MPDDKIPEWRKKQLDSMLECVIDATAILRAFIEHTSGNTGVGDEFITQVALEFYRRRQEIDQRNENAAKRSR